MQLRLLEAQNRALSAVGDRMASRCSNEAQQMRAFCERELLKLRASLKEAEECRATLKARVSSLEERLAESDSLYDCTVQNIRVHRTQQLVLC